MTSFLASIAVAANMSLLIGAYYMTTSNHKGVRGAFLLSAFLLLILNTDVPIGAYLRWLVGVGLFGSGLTVGMAWAQILISGRTAR